MFGLEDQVDSLMEGFHERISVLQEIAENKTAIVGMCTSGSFNVLGNEASFEFVVQKAPDYIFVLDRDAAISREGAQLAKDIMENELVMSTDVYKNGNLIYLAHPAVWYTAEGGITARNARYTATNRALRKGMEELGFKAYIDEAHQGPIITTFFYPENCKFTFAKMYAYLKDHGYVIYPGKLTDAETFRLGNIGEIYMDDVEKILGIFKDFVSAEN